VLIRHRYNVLNDELLLRLRFFVLLTNINKRVVADIVP
jgi:hypothetical protein